jgi:ribosomal protein L11 methyltransferase
MDSVTYITLEIQGVPAEKEDLITHFLFENGAAGVQENLQFTQLDRKYQPTVVEAEVKTLLAYFEQPPSPEVIENLKTHYPEVSVQSKENETEDWLAQWKEQWKPFELIKGLWIVPEWYREEFEGSDRKAIFIEPGMAFGTGTHATTQIASLLMRYLFQNQEVKSMVDVGTGSGILSFLAAFEDLENIYAYDNDPESHRVFHENLEKNPSDKIQWLENWPTELAGKLDLTLANIIDGVLLDLKPLFQKVNSPFYIFTGILAEREKIFLEEMTQDWNLKVLKRVEKSEWVGFLFERQG